MSNIDSSLDWIKLINNFSHDVKCHHESISTKRRGCSGYAFLPLQVIKRFIPLFASNQRNKTPRQNKWNINKDFSPLGNLSEIKLAFFCAFHEGKEAKALEIVIHYFSAQLGTKHFPRHDSANRFCVPLSLFNSATRKPSTDSLPWRKWEERGAFLSLSFYFNICSDDKLEDFSSFRGKYLLDSYSTNVAVRKLFKSHFPIWLYSNSLKATFPPWAQTKWVL